ncbi:MAG: hypothetical protein CMJ90_12850 [Planctomycetes bacterium]|nr:hypothetical protein [Planctomycetota bacterium]
MTLLRPEALFALPVLVALLLWARHRARRRPRPALTWMLFARALERTPDVPTRRRPIVRDLLRILPAAVVVLALARPAWSDRSPREAVFVVDGTASMKTLVDGASRRDRGVAAARALVHGPYRVVEALDDLAGLAADHAFVGEAAVVVTDTPLEVADGVGVVGVVDQAANVGITACGVGADGGLLVRVSGCHLRGPATLTLEGLGALAAFVIDRVPWRRVFLPPPAWVDRVVVRVSAEGDANSADDVVTLTRVRRLTIGFPPRGHDALWRAFDAHPRADVFRGDGPCDLRIGDGEAVARLWVAPRGGTSPRPVSGVLTCHGSSLTGDLALDALHRPDGQGGEAGAVLARVGGEPLVVRRPDGLVLLQDPDTSSWSDDPSFPLLCAQMPTWLGLEGAGVLTADTRAVLSELETVGPWLVEAVARAPRAGVLVDHRTLLDGWVYALAALLVLLVRPRSRAA